MNIFTYENIVVMIAAILYILVGLSYLLKGNFPWALVWFAYGVANGGLIWAVVIATNK